MLHVHDLRCEYAANPLGIGASIPRLGWKLSHAERNQRQSAYRVVAAASAAALLGSGQDLLWDSGKSASSASLAVEYGGTPLASRQRVYWRVRCWDSQDRPSEWSEPAWFETALLHPNDWQATWIGCPAAWPWRAINLRRAFVVDRPVVRARLYVAGLGYCESFVNSERLGDAVLDPANTDASRRVMYRTFDAPDHLQVGENVLGFALGNGWHGQTRLLAQLEILDSDGNTITFAMGPQGGWLAAPSATIENSVYGGETYDARAETPGWDLPHWGKAAGEARPGGWLAAMSVPPPGRARDGAGWGYAHHACRLWPFQSADRGKLRIKLVSCCDDDSQLPPTPSPRLL